MGTGWQGRKISIASSTSRARRQAAQRHLRTLAATVGAHGCCTSCTPCCRSGSSSWSVAVVPRAVMCATGWTLSLLSALQKDIKPAAHTAAAGFIAGCCWLLAATH